MNKIIIGVTARIHSDDKNIFVRVNKNYLDQLTMRGMETIIIGPTNYSHLLPLCDGFLVIGGDDFNPQLYHEENKGFSRGVNDELDQLDADIISYAEENSVPLLGICRGIQAISAIHHRCLYQDLEDNNLQHPAEEKIHSVTKIKNLTLSSRLPENFMVNTFHHQAVKDLPQGYVATFVNGNVIEAIEHLELPIFAVQWHPERLDTNETKIIFDYFKELIINNKK